MGDTFKAFLEKLSEDDKQKLMGMWSGARSKTSPPEGGDSKGAAGGLINMDGERNGVVNELNVKLPRFSGVVSKSETSYRLWKFEVENLERTYNPTVVKRAIHRSVTGMAAETLMRLGQDATVAEIKTKFDNIFGIVINKQKLLSEFYTAKQRSSESVADWVCRLEDILSHPELRNTPQRDDMLKTQFFHGLSSSIIQNNIRHQLDTSSFEELVIAARSEENLLSFKAEKAISKTQVSESNDPVLKKLEELMKCMNELKTKSEEWGKRIGKLEQSQPKQPYQPVNQTAPINAGSSKTVKCYYCKKEGHIKKDCKKLLNKQQSAVQGN